MKKFLIVFLLPFIFLSCESLPINYSRSQSWLTSDNSSQMTISLLSVQVDRAGGWDSVEKEIIDLAPLYFWNNGCRVVAVDEAPCYAAEIQAREREFSQGWRTRRSLAIEVRISSYKGSASAAKLPLAAGRVVAIGERSLSSSDTTGRMLSKAIAKAVKELAAHELGN